jgi:hypothetical protein
MRHSNVSKACKIVCQEIIPACSDDTVQKLRDLNPERSLNLNLEKSPTHESLNAFWDGEEGTALRNKIFSVTKVRKYFRTFQALGATDIDGWRGREQLLYLFTNNDTELHQLIIDELIFPYVTGEFLPLFPPKLAGGLLFAFLKKDGGLRPLLCGSIWHRCAARLTSDCTRDAAHTYFTTTYPNFMQCAGGLQDGATRCAQLVNMLHDLPTDDQDPPLTRSRARLKSHMMMGRCSLVMTSPPLKNYFLSLDTSTPCTAPPPTTVTVINAGTRITSKTQQG